MRAKLVLVLWAKTSSRTTFCANAGHPSSLLLPHRVVFLFPHPFESVCLESCPSTSHHLRPRSKAPRRSPAVSTTRRAPRTPSRRVSRAMETPVLPAARYARLRGSMGDAEFRRWRDLCSASCSLWKKGVLPDFCWNICSNHVELTHPLVTSTFMVQRPFGIRYQISAELWLLNTGL